MGHDARPSGAMLHAAVRWSGRHRAALQSGIDLAAWVVGLWSAVLVRFDLDAGAWPTRDVWTACALATALQVAVGVTAGLYRRRWRFGSFDEVAALVRSVVVVAVGLLAATALRGAAVVPSSVAVAGAVFALMGMGSSRYLWRMVIDRRLRPSPDHATKVVVFGAGEAGIGLVTSMLRNPDSPYYPVALLDDDPVKAHLQIMGIPVLGGRDALGEVASRLGARHVVVAAPSAPSALIRELSNLAMRDDLEVSVLPQVADLLGGRVDVRDVRPVDERDLLGRHEIDTDVAQIADYLTGRRVLVTGAGGSIGSELCRQIHAFAPATLVLVDRDESALHGVQLSIHGRALLDTRDTVVADIRDRGRMLEVFSEHRPHVVFHAAALKHLPLLELYPAEGWKTNVEGTANLLAMAERFGVDRFINISTDKAADPTSVLGRTKRVAERLTAASATRTGSRYLSVRFGNVLGSRGSVLEAFRRQLDAGGPLTVTHPDVTRYFMLVEEAVQLVIQAGAIGRNGEALVLDMGAPVRIVDVARRLAAQTEPPTGIVFTGLRPGEKLHEVLLGGGELDHRPAHPLISHVAVPPIDLAELLLEASSVVPAMPTPIR